MEAYASIQASAVSWEWHIQLDGDCPEIDTGISEDPRVTVATNQRQLGIAISRNRALARATAPFVKPLDADDLLPAESLVTALEALRTHPEAAFVCGLSTRLGPDGAVTDDAPPPLEKGLIPEGRLEELWRERGASPIRYGTLCWRQDVLAAHGGWAALSEMEDVSLTLAVNLRHPGLFIDKQLLLSRDHAGQASISDACIRDRPLNRELVHQRLMFLRKLYGMELPPGFEQAPPDHSTPRAQAKARRLRNLD